MSLYLLINILIILFPLIFSFEKQILFINKLPYYLISILVISPLFIIWDSYATQRGDWGFSAEYINGLKLFHLPLEEILFFITVPYSTIFLFEVAHVYLPEKKVAIPNVVFFVFAFLLIVLAGVFNEQYYTATVSVFSAVSLILLAVVPNRLRHSRNFYIFLAFSFIPFLLVNYWLTVMPVVWYSDSAIFGKRFLTIPIEDFLYSFSMITLWVFVYDFVKEKFQRRKDG